MHSVRKTAASSAPRQALLTRSGHSSPCSLTRNISMDRHNLTLHSALCSSASSACSTSWNIVEPTRAPPGAMPGGSTPGTAPALARVSASSCSSAWMPENLRSTGVSKGA